MKQVTVAEAYSTRAITRLPYKYGSFKVLSIQMYSRIDDSYWLSCEDVNAPVIANGSTLLEVVPPAPKDEYDKVREAFRAGMGQAFYISQVTDGPLSLPDYIAPDGTPGWIAAAPPSAPDVAAIRTKSDLTPSEVLLPFIEDLKLLLAYSTEENERMSASLDTANARIAALEADRAILPIIKAQWDELTAQHAADVATIENLRNRLLEAETALGVYERRDTDL